MSGHDHGDHGPKRFLDRRRFAQGCGATVALAAAGPTATPVVAESTDG